MEVIEEQHPGHAVYLSPRYIKKLNPIMQKKLRGPSMGQFQVFTRTKDSREEIGTRAMEEILSGGATPPSSALP